ncbi:glycosyltransferase involved in cell wall biosynthesis [Pseudacidovorax intermedius]|uniref:Glycosyltransferase involved in cell wall biosynthesis n=1 Tax=Pseudacidovorax intermedius TaxID=433924 RepID=A0A370FHS9_9BURK|nr:glycosyltransferase [Pseudacidovorax intermedius]RDI24961.1 glycosyltransferase involved in cell wall biosynthesis [Pseudacidovorax intermedius]
MRIKFIVHNLGSVRVGGVERVVAELANELAKRHTVEVVSVVRDDVPAFPIAPEVSLSSFGLIHCDTSGLSSRQKILWCFQCLCAIGRYFLRTSAEDILLIQSPRLGFIASLINVFLRRRVFVCEHQAFGSIRNKFYRSARLYTYKFVEGVIVLSTRDGENFKSYGIKTHLVRNFAGRQFLPHKQQSFGKNLFYIGRLDIEQKNLLTMLDMFFQSGLWRKGFSMTFVGNGPAERILKERANELDLNEFVSFFPFSTKVKEFYRQANIFVMTSNYEGFPLALIEAMSQGVPCVAFDCDYGPRELIVNGHNGYLINPRNPIDEFSERILEICASPAIYARFSDAARDTASNYSIENAVLDWEKSFAK